MQLQKNSAVAYHGQLITAGIENMVCIGGSTFKSSGIIAPGIPYRCNTIFMIKCFFEKCLQFGWASGVMAASSLNDYAEPADEKQVWDVYAGNARVQR